MRSVANQSLMILCVSLRLIRAVVCSIIMGYGAVAATDADAYEAHCYTYSPPVSHECEYLEISPDVHTPGELLRSYSEARWASVRRQVAAAAVAFAAIVGVTSLSIGHTDATVLAAGRGSLAALQSAATYVTYKSSAACTVNCGGDDLVFPHEVYSVEGHLEYTLEVNTFRYEGPMSLNMRAYDGKVAGPTLVASPGDRVTIHLKNSLEETSADSSVIETQKLWSEGELDTSSCEALGEANMTSLHFQVRDRVSVRLRFEAFLIPLFSPSLCFLFKPRSGHARSELGLPALGWVGENRRAGHVRDLRVHHFT